MKLLLAGLLFSSIAAAQQPAAPTEQRFFETMAVAAGGTHLGKTTTVGPNTGGGYSDLRPEGAVLVGLDLWKGNYGGPVIGGICPIYQTATGRVRGKKQGTYLGGPVTLEAKPGFVVGGIEARAGERVEGIQLVFMRLNMTTMSLETEGSYKSKWVGGRTQGKEIRLIPNQKPILGIFGGAGVELDRIGLYYFDRK